MRRVKNRDVMPYNIQLVLSMTDLKNSERIIIAGFPKLQYTKVHFRIVTI